MLDLALLSSLSGMEGSGNVVDCGGGFTAGDNTVSLADWHKTDDPWGAYLVDHHPPQGHTVYVPYGQGGPDVHGCAGGTPGCYANGDHPAGLHTTALGAGPEVYNNMGASHNCVGGSEQGCIPKNPPVGDASKTGMGSTLPAPAHWYANGGHPTGMHTTALGAGPEVYNNMEASHNCVGGSEQGCIPKNPPVGDASKTGMSSTLPAPAHWYANGEGAGMVASKEIAGPMLPADVENKGKVVNATPGHLVLGCHAFTLAAIQGMFKGDMKDFSQDAVENAEAVTPVGAHLVRRVTA